MIVPLVPGVGIAAIVVPAAMPTPKTLSPTKSPVVLTLVMEVDVPVVVPVVEAADSGSTKERAAPVLVVVAAADKVIVPLVPGVGIAAIVVPAAMPVPVTLSPTTNPVVLTPVTDLFVLVVDPWVTVLAVPK